MNIHQHLFPKICPTHPLLLYLDTKHPVIWHHLTTTICTHISTLLTPPKSLSHFSFPVRKEHALRSCIRSHFRFLDCAFTWEVGDPSNLPKGMVYFNATGIRASSCSPRRWRRRDPLEIGISCSGDVSCLCWVGSTHG